MKEIFEIFMKHFDEMAFAKEMALKYAKPGLLAFKAKVDSGEIDIIKGTDIDKAVVDKVLDLIIEKL